MTWEQMELIEATDWEFFDLMEWSIKPDQKSTDAIGLNEFLRKSQILNPLKMMESQHYGKKVYESTTSPPLGGEGKHPTVSLPHP